MAAASRYWRMDCPCGRVPRRPSTPPWSRPLRGRAARNHRPIGYRVTRLNRRRNAHASTTPPHIPGAGGRAPLQTGCARPGSWRQVRPGGRGLLTAVGQGSCARVPCAATPGRAACILAPLDGHAGCGGATRVGLLAPGVAVGGSRRMRRHGATPR